MFANLVRLHGNVVSYYSLPRAVKKNFAVTKCAHCPEKVDGSVDLVRRECHLLEHMSCGGTLDAGVTVFICVPEPYLEVEPLWMHWSHCHIDIPSRSLFGGIRD